MRDTYPAVIIENASSFIGFIPDIYLYADGATKEEAIQCLQERISEFFSIAEGAPFDIPKPSKKETLAEKWQGFEIVLI